MNIFSEMNQRKVTRTAIAYLVAGWLILEITSVVAPALYLPDWTTTMVLFLLAIGFPVALILAWSFDITAEGLQKAPEQGKKSSLPVIALIVVTLLSISGAWYYTNSQSRNAAEMAELDASIAVLPFANFSSDPNQDYFVDGLSEEILNYLAKSQGLRVIARTSSFAFRGQDLDMRHIGAQLGVSHLLEGSVRKQGNQIRVTAQLIRANDGSHIWSESYDRTLDNVFALQDELSESITAVINAHLLPDRRIVGQTPGAASTTTAMAQHTPMREDYLRANWLIHQPKNDSTRENLTTAIAMLEQIVIEEPTFTEAWISLAGAYNDAGSFTRGFMPRGEARDKSMNAAQRAIELGPDMSEAWLVYAQTQHMSGMHTGRYIGLAAADKAIELNPNNAAAYAAKAGLLRINGGYSAFFEATAKAIELDPLGEESNQMQAYSLIYQGRHEEAKALIDSWNDKGVDPVYVRSYGSLNAAFSGDFEWLHQLAQQMKAEGISGEAWVRNRIAEAYMTLGMEEEAQLWAAPQSTMYLAYANGDFKEVYRITAEEDQLSGTEQRDKGLLSLWDRHPLAIMIAGIAGENEWLEKELNDHEPDWLSGIFAMTHFRYRTTGLGWTHAALNAGILGYEAFVAPSAEAGLATLDTLNRLGYDRPDYDYERARLYALWGKPDQALDSLERAIKRGHKSWEIKVDPSLDSLRDLPRYEAIIADYDAMIADLRNEIETQR